MNVSVTIRHEAQLSQLFVFVFFFYYYHYHNCVQYKVVSWNNGIKGCKVSFDNEGSLSVIIYQSNSKRMSLSKIPKAVSKHIIVYLPLLVHEIDIVHLSRNCCLIE